MNEWMNERMNQDQLINQPINESTNEWMKMNNWKSNCILKKDEKCEEEDRNKKKTVKRGGLQKAYLLYSVPIVEKIKYITVHIFVYLLISNVWICWAKNNAAQST